MHGQQQERWRTLCEEIANERDPGRFSQLIERLLEELHKKEETLNGSEPDQGSAA